MDKLIVSVDVPCVIIPKKTGVVYVNQVGGYACHQLKIEGFIIPLGTYFFERVKKGEKSNSSNPFWNKFSFQEHFDRLFAPLKNKTKYQGHGYKGIDEEDALYIERVFENDTFLKVVVNGFENVCLGRR